MIQIYARLRIPLTEFHFTFVRSSGPGGQSVNKLSTKAVLRWDLLGSPSLSLEDRLLLQQKLSSKLTKEGHIVLTSDRTRDQLQNKEDCLNKIEELLRSALIKPKPRKKTKPSKSSMQRVKDSKSRRSAQKKFRKVSPKDY